MKTKTEPLYPVGIAAIHKYEQKRGRLVTCKWSKESGWWYEIRYPDGFQRSVPEADIVPTED